MPDYPITLTDSPAPADIEVVRQGLESYDASQGAVVDWVPLALFARDPEENIIAGLTGSTYWGYLYVGRLWTDQRLRQTGLGSQLLEQAEQEARRRGCHSAHLMTGDFNALPFYLKRGYVVRRIARYAARMRKAIGRIFLHSNAVTCPLYSALLYS